MNLGRALCPAASIGRIKWKNNFFIIARRLLDLVVSDMKEKGISHLYVVTDHTGFYERYGWEFFCMAQGDDEPEQTRLYIHR